MRSRQSQAKQVSSSSPTLQCAPNSSPTHANTSAPPSGLNASFARTPVLSVQRAPSHVAITPGFGGQIDLSLTAPTPRPALSPVIQRQVDDPDGAIWKRFVAAARAGGLSRYDVDNATGQLSQIFHDNDTESDAWDDWVAYWKRVGPGICHKAANVIAQKMKQSKEKLEKVDQDIGKITYDETMEEEEKKRPQTLWGDEEPIDWANETFGGSETNFKQKLETHYPRLQDLSERVLWEMYVEEGYLGPKGSDESESKDDSEDGDGRSEEESSDDDFVTTKLGQQCLNKAIVKSQKREGMDLSRIEQSFILNHFTCSKSGSMKTRTNPENEHLTLNYQANRSVKSQGVPGIGTYDNHLSRLSDKAAEGGLALNDLFKDREGSHEERVKRMKHRLSQSGKKLKEQKLNALSETLVKEEDKSEALNVLEQDRSYRDCLATSTAFEGIGSLWGPKQGFKTLNPMYHDGATTAAIQEQEGVEFDKKQKGNRQKTISVAKDVLNELITKTMDETTKPGFQKREGLFRRGHALRLFLEDPDNQDAELAMENEVRRLYNGSRKRPLGDTNPEPERPKKKRKVQEEEV